MQDQPIEFSREYMEGLVNMTSTHVLPGTTVTIVHLQLESGYEITGESHCSRPETFNAEVGIQMAKDKAYAKLAALLEFQQVEDEWRRVSKPEMYLTATQKLALNRHDRLLSKASDVVNHVSIVMGRATAEDEVRMMAELREAVADAGGKVPA